MTRIETHISRPYRFIGSASVGLVAASFFGSATAVERPNAGQGLVDHLATTSDFATRSRTPASIRPAGDLRDASFVHSGSVLPLLVSDIAAAAQAPRFPLVRRTAGVRPPLISAPVAAR